MLLTKRGTEVKEFYPGKVKMTIFTSLPLSAANIFHEELSECSPASLQIKESSLCGGEIERGNPH